MSPEKGGLGWHISESGNQLETSNLFADLFIENIISLVAAKFVFVTIEEGTNHRAARGTRPRQLFDSVKVTFE